MGGGGALRLVLCSHCCPHGAEKSQLAFKSQLTLNSLVVCYPQTSARSFSHMRQVVRSCDQASQEKNLQEVMSPSTAGVGMDELISLQSDRPNVAQGSFKGCGRKVSLLGGRRVREPTTASSC